jgi:hypothetical protein
MLRRGVRQTARVETPRRHAVHSGGIQASVLRRYTRVTHGRRNPDARATCWALRRRRPSPVLFRLSLFEIAKLQKSSTNLKISKNKGCRGAIDLQLSQRATYVLINSLSGNVGRSWQNSRPQVTVHSALNLIFCQFALKIGMSTNYEKCVPGNNEQLSNWLILNFYSEIWRTPKKTKSAF